MAYNGTGGIEEKGADRRFAVPFDPRLFEKEGEAGSAREIFQRIYRTSHWAADTSVSGEGAAEAQTAVLGAALPLLCREFQVRTLLDVPCGDFSWMQHVDLSGVAYVGGDIVPEIVARNRDQFSSPYRTFIDLDLLTDALPAADLLLCRDLLVHFSFADVERALVNVRRSRIRFLLTTTFPGTTENENIATGDWRPINLERPPFNLPPPARLINEGCTEGRGAFRDKSLGLWRVDDLNAGA